MPLRNKLSGFKSGFHAFGLSVNKVVSFLVLAFVYFVGIGFTSVLGKIAGKKFLKLEKQQTYWETVSISPRMEECKQTY